MEPLILLEMSDAISLGFAGMIAVTTVVYSVLTFTLVAETRRMRKAQTEPKIAVSIAPKDDWLFLLDMTIENIGPGPAHDVRFRVQPDFTDERGRRLADVGPIKHGIQFLSPGQKIRFYLSDLRSLGKDQKLPQFVVVATYRNLEGERYEDVFNIDFSEWENLTRIGEPPMHAIVSKLDSLSRSLNQIASNLRR